MDGLPEFLFGGWRPLLRILVVGAPAFAGLLLLLRASGKHSLTKSNAYGFVVTVALGSTLSSGVISGDVSLAEGLAAVGLLLGLQHGLSLLNSRTRWAARLFTNEPRVVLLNGGMVQEALREERVNESEVRAAVRSSGVASLEEVALVVLETDGSFSVIRSVNGGRSALSGVRGA